MARGIACAVAVALARLGEMEEDCVHADALVAVWLIMQWDARTMHVAVCDACGEDACKGLNLAIADHRACEQERVAEQDGATTRVSSLTCKTSHHGV